MRAVVERIRTDGRVLPGGFLRVDGFLNHRIDPGFVGLAGDALSRAFADARPTCVLTAEAAGNVIAYETARQLGAAALYAKKGATATMARALVCRLRSPTKGDEVDLCVSADYLCAGERVLVVDDFLHRGTTSAALGDMVLQAGAELVGFGFVVEKRPSGGREALARFRVPVLSLAVIVAMDADTGEIVFAG